MRLSRGIAAPRRFVLLLLLPLAACYADPESARWGRGESVGQLIVQRVDRSAAGGTVDVAGLSPFRWERLYIFPSGSAATLVRDSLGIGWIGAARGSEARQPESTLFIFIGQGEGEGEEEEDGEGDVLAATMVPTSLLGVAPELVGRSYSAQEASFRVEIGPDGRRRLVP